MLNAGNRQGSPVMRVKLDGRRREVEAFDVYGPKGVAVIGNLPTTVADRSIPIRMKRRVPHEKVARFRDRQARAEALPIRCPAFSVAGVPDVPVPEDLNDRAADGWEPLLMVAAVAGEDWPERAQRAALALSAGDEVEVSVGMRLLAEIREGFDHQGTDHLTTSALLDWLHGLEEAPWADWYGKPLTARALARLLAPYRVRPIKRRLDGAQTRGYFRSEFTDAWQRYVPAVEPATTATTAPLNGDGTHGTDGALPQDPTELPFAWADEEPTR